MIPAGRWGVGDAIDRVFDDSIGLRFSYKVTQVDLPLDRAWAGFPFPVSSHGGVG